MLFILSFTHPNVVANLYDCISSVEEERIYFEKCHIMEVNGIQCLLVPNQNEFCRRKSYRFGRTWEWV